MSVKRIYVEKKSPFAVKAKELKEEIINYLGIQSIENVRVLIRYDVENILEDTYRKSLGTVFCEPPVDILYETSFDYLSQDVIFSVEYLPGQFDQRADSAKQCVKLLNENEEPVIRTATTYVLSGDLTEAEIEKIKSYCINPVDSRQSQEEIPDTLKTIFEEPADVKIFDGFISFSQSQLKELYDSLNLAMTFKDFIYIKDYFKNEEKRNPSMTEIRVLDTYWSDHCRHTTFHTELKNIEFEDGFYRTPIEETYNEYIKDRNEIFKGRKDKYVCLMDLALIGMRRLKKEGRLDDQEETDEINACSIVVPVEIDGEVEEWLINFKNETHNHPTEIEPFGGAATCLGGAIRDPLSGRTYVYQAMRITGAANPTKPLEQTLKGKLPQKKIVTGAAKGYSSYGNQIGLATGYVKEIYHPNYEAKRLEIGAVMGAAPRKNVIRETSGPGDVIILLGGRTGRDGCGGATGSSKVHTEDSIETCGAEVQKGNPPTERKLQRLFRRKEVSSIIKKCNDFGAGGVSVAIGELADGLQIFLDKVPKKYAGLDGTEIAISESQERMAVVVDKKDVKQMLDYAASENLEAVEVAVVTKEKRLVMYWRDKEIVNISRAFLDTNGAHQETDVKVTMPKSEENYFKKQRNKAWENVKTAWLDMLGDLNVCSQKGLVEMFDSSIGAGSVLMPYGGRYQLTETQSMVAKLPVENGKTDTVTMMSYGFNPYLSSWSPYHGAIYAVVESISKIVACGGDYSKIRMTYQEYFRRMTEDKTTWGEPFAALLGAYSAQIGFGLPSIGGKDSMSGTFNEINVPPTLVSFAVDVASNKTIITPQLKKAGSYIVHFAIKKDEYDLPCYDQIKALYSVIFKAIKDGFIISAYALEANGIAQAISKMAFGNKLGVKIHESVDKATLFMPAFGDIIAEIPHNKLFKLEQLNEIFRQLYKNSTQNDKLYTPIAIVTEQPKFIYRDVTIDMNDSLKAWMAPLEKVFPTKSGINVENIEKPVYKTDSVYVCKHKVAKPTVFIPIFPGTNCEYDSERAFKRAGANVITKVFTNMTPDNIRESVDEFAKAIDKSQIIMFPGGFSAGDEPDGSAKFFATSFRNEKLKEAVENLLHRRDGLILGICNGFQALIKLGLVPYGDIVEQKADSPTLTTNTIGRHISKMVYTKVVTNKSPWLCGAILGGVYCNPASHGEGRFVASQEWIEKLFANGQVATQYVDFDGNPAKDEEWNPNGSYAAIEGITSLDGRIFGKMAHSERRGNAVAINIYGEQDMKIFESGVNYFK